MAPHPPRLALAPRASAKPISDRASIIGIGTPCRVRCKPVGSPFSSPVYRGHIYMSGRIFDQEVRRMLPRRSGTSMFLQPINDQPAALEFPHCSRRWCAGGSPFLSPGCRNWRYLNYVMIRGCHPMTADFLLEKYLADECDNKMYWVFVL